MKKGKRKGRRTENPQHTLPYLGDLSGLISDHEKSDLESAVLSRPPKSIRVRASTAWGLGQTLSVPFATEPVPWYSEGRYCIDTHQPGRYLMHSAGGYFVQDAGSMLALRLLEAQPTEWIADLCASPGAKASAILETVGPGGGFLLANEPIRGRLPALAFNLARVGFPRYAITTNDPEQLATTWTSLFDGVLVDAPCTGQTLLGRGKQSASAFAESQVAHAAARQQRILQAAAPLVRPGGRLVYSTCTFAAAENEHVVANFLDSHPEWIVEPCKELNIWQSPMEPGGYRLYPHRDRCAGAYAIRLRKEGDSDQSRHCSIEDKGAFTPLRIGDEVVGETRQGRRTERRLSWEEYPEDIVQELGDFLGQGSEVAYCPAKHWMPAHELALRRDENWRPAQIFELDDQLARQFLQGHALPVGPTGWSVATWKAHPLGWIRGNRDRSNNGLPNSVRLGFAPLIES